MIAGTKHVYQFGSFRLDASDRLLYRDGDLIALPPKVFDTLLLLVASGGRVLGKDEMMKQLWPDTFVEEGTLSQYVFLLRKMLGDSAAWIENHPRRGYRFTAQVEELRNGLSKVTTDEHTRNRAADEQETVTQRAPASRFRVTASTLGLLAVITAAALIWTNQRGRSPASFDSVAVLPFRTVSDSENDYLADGITEALVTKLAGLKELRVVPYSRVRRFKGSSLEGAEIGRQLGVDAVIEGTVRVTSGHLRLNVQAVDAKSGYTLWAVDRFEANSASLLDIEGQLAQTVALRLKGQLTAGERSLISRSRTRNAEAYDLALRARGVLRGGTSNANLESAIPMLNRAVQLDPGFAEAYGWLALAQHRTYHNGVGGVDLLRAAISNANQALSRDPNALIAMRAVAHIQHSTGREVEGLLMARRALESNPDDLDAIAAAAEAYFRTGLYDRAIPLFQKALAWEPDNREFRSQLARMYLFLGEYKKGLEVISILPPRQAGIFGMFLYAEAGQMGKAIEAAKSGRQGYFGHGYFEGCALAAAGDLRGAREIWTAGVRQAKGRLERHDNPYTHAFLGKTYAKLGERAQALYHVDRSLAPDPHIPVFLFFAAQTRALLGERRQALETLRSAIENGFFNLPMIEYVARPTIGDLYSLRNDPEFHALRADLARRVDELRARY